VSLDQNRKLIQPWDGVKKSTKIRTERPGYTVIVIEGMGLPLEPDMVFTHSLSLRCLLLGFKIFSWRIWPQQGHTGPE
jgi:hypothetical protein